MIDLGRRIGHALDRVAWARDVLDFQPDDWQKRLLRSESRQIEVNAGRQVGKSETLAHVACHTAIFQDESLTLLIAPSQRQSAELAARVIALLDRIEPMERLDEDNSASPAMDRA
jgi:hypothetical protein